MIHNNTLAASKKQEPGTYSYTGDRDHTIRHGYGKLHFSNPYFYYEGNYMNGFRHGPGTLYLGNTDNPDTVIKGTFINGEIEGWGTKIWKDGKIFTGEFKNGEIEGQGRIEIPGEQRMYYEGQFVRGAFHGTGKQTITVLSTVPSSVINDTDKVKDAEYEGVVDTVIPEPEEERNKNNRPRLQIEERNTNDGSSLSPITITTTSSTTHSIPSSYTETYTGEFRYNKREGLGKLERDNHHPEYLYEGNFWNNLYHGEGLLYYDNHGYYEGSWYEGKRHGNGKLVYPKHVDTLSYSGSWCMNFPLHLPSSFSVHVLPWKVPKITTWPPPLPSPPVTEPTANSASASKSGATKTPGKASTTANPSTNKAVPATTLPVVTNPYPDLPLYRPGAVVIPVGGKLPPVKVSIMYINPEKKAVVDERRAKEAKEAAAKAAEEAALAAAEAERKRLEMEEAAAANKGKKPTPVTTSPASKATAPTPAVTTTVTSPTVVPPPDHDGWKNTIEEYEEFFNGENGRHIELSLVAHETIQTQFSTEVVKAREEAKKAAEQAAIASTVSETVSSSAASSTKTGKATATGNKLTTPPTSPRSPSKLKSAITKVTTITSFMRIPSSPTLTPPPSIEPPVNAPSVSLLVPPTENSQREGSTVNELQSLQNDINGTIIKDTVEENTDTTTDTDLSTFLSTASVHTFTQQSTGILQQIHIPSTVQPGQYTLILQDTTANLPYGKKLKTVYIPVDILPSNAW